MYLESTTIAINHVASSALQGLASVDFALGTQSLIRFTTNLVMASSGSIEPTSVSIIANPPEKSWKLECLFLASVAHVN
ncbi:hypothetical protein PILCRDRAFT_811254 [Piloderma croceum F 1598]|uniref:Uncharacterized protein n=1 Tax=Piloderma croceum (strain F 1598) TaxID=765440 RepID=A0A0C3G3B8_PILCF|nr:hypothetical protein PILCRDRAFT_811254 [Piloderma croceum F 1598]